MINKVLKNNKGQTAELFMAIMLFALTVVAVARFVMPAFKLVTGSQDEVARTRIQDIERTYSQVDLGPISLTGLAVKNEMDTIVRNTFQNGADRWIFVVGGTTLNTGSSANKDKYVVSSMSPSVSINDERIYVKTTNISSHTITYTLL